MSQGYTYTTGEKKHPQEKERNQIEAVLKAKKTAGKIAGIIGCSKRTIEREFERGKVTQL